MLVVSGGAIRPQIVVMSDGAFARDQERGLRHVEILAVPSSPGDARLDLVCRLRFYGTFHYEDERVVVNGPPTCFWCLSDKRIIRSAR